MKILYAPVHYIYENNKYGSEFQQAFNVVDPICELWTDSVVITGKKDSDLIKKYKIIEAQPSIAIRNSSFITSTLFTFRYSYKIIKILKQDRFDIYHHVRPFQIGRTFNLIVLLNLHKKMPFVIGSFCSPYIAESNSGVPKIVDHILRKLSHLTLKKADKIVVYDEYTKSLLHKSINRNKIEVIPPGLSGKVYSPTNKSSNSSKCVVSVGSLIPRKNFDLLIRAFSGVVDKVPDAVLKIYGDGSEKSNLIDLINSLNLNDNVQLKGFVENKYMPNIYKGASIFALIQHEESFGQVYLEAMASGLPIVTSKNIGSEQIIKPNFGTLVDLNDVNKCTRAIISLLKNDEKRNEFSTNARQEFEKKYDIQVSTLKYIKLYESLLAKH